MKLAIIPARGGSKRIPRKNVQQFGGRPMISYAIRAALSSNTFDRVVVSTDDDEVAEVAEGLGAEVPFRRSEELANDHAGILEVVADAVGRLGAEADVVSLVYATVPLLKGETLASAVAEFERAQAPFFLAAAEFHYPVQRGFYKAGEGIEMLFPDAYHTRSQDLRPVYHDAAQFCIARGDTWLSAERIFVPETGLFIVPPDTVCDIDTPDDWARAELAFQIAREQHRQSPAH